jgi:hypothetical protein
MSKAITGYWFYWMLVPCLIAAWRLSLMPEAVADPLTLERVYLIDCAVLLPFLYFLYLRSRVAFRAAILRSAALGAATLSYAAWLMPEGTGQVLPFLSWLRWAALPAIILIELAAFVALIRYLYGDEPQEDVLIGQGLPPLMVKLLLTEARLWKRVFRFLTGKGS